MPFLLVVLLVVVPLAELAVILQVGSYIGAGWTIVLLVIDSIVGAILLRIEGRRAWSDFRRALSAGRWPGDEVTQGGLVIVGGALLLTPGFITDLVGFLLLLGPTRSWVGGQLRRRMVERSPFGRTSSRRPGETRSPSGDTGLEVEVVEIEREQRAVDPGADDEPPEATPR